MKILIIGASGFIGRHILAYAKSLGYEVLGTASRPRPAEGLLGLDLAKDRLTDKVPVSFFQAGGPIFVVVSAAICQIDCCYREREVTRAVNVANTIRLMEEAAVLGARPVYLTSSFVFDGRAGYYTESDTHSPISEYGRQKADIESHCCQRNLDWFLVRLDKIVGDDPAEGHLFAEWYRWSQAKHPIVCMANQLFSPTHVDDVARAIILGCQKGLTGLYNVANSEYFYRDELARQFFKLLGREASIVCKTQQELGFADLRPEKSYLDAGRFVQATGLRFLTMRQVMSRFKDKIGKEIL